MDTAATNSTRKLWIGFGLMCLSCVIWVIVIRWMVGEVGADPMVRVGATPAEVEAALASRSNPLTMMTRMMTGYAITGVVFLGGVIVTGLGMIDYAAEVRARMARG
jgi:hypothetical protein